MADTFTPNFELVLPEIGGSPDTWGNKLNSNFSEVDGRLIPSGLIALWSGSVANIPAGWALCDGTGSTPDLRDRFLVGAGGSYSVGDTGGSDDVALTLGQIPAHDHGGGTGESGAHTHTGSATGTGSSHTHSGTAASAGGHTHNIAGLNVSVDSSPVDGLRAARGATLGSGSTNLAGAHTHDVSIPSSGSHSHTLSINSNGAHTHSIPSQGGGESHENRPPYYALAYIMKL